VGGDLGISWMACITVINTHSQCATSFFFRTCQRVRPFVQSIVGALAKFQ
jgi:hypothetical protein